MSKFYTLRSMDGQLCLATVTKATARGMVHRGEAAYVPGRSAIQLVPPAVIPANPPKDVKPGCRAMGKDFRGLSASPNANLMRRYSAAKTSHCKDDLAAEVIAAVDGLDAVKDIAGRTIRDAVEGWSQ